MKKILTPEDFSFFQSLLVEKAGIFVRQEDANTLENHLFLRKNILKLDDYQTYYQYLKFHDQKDLEIKNLLDIITINETFFFRNEPQFQAIREFLLPAICSQKRKNRDLNLRIWSAGCSSGDEIYTVAIILSELLPDIDHWKISLLGTDINRKILMRAREALYSERAVRLIPSPLLQRYFVRKDHLYALSPQIKSRVEFSYHNLATDPYDKVAMMDADLIFCRNVLIYFHPDIVKKVIGQFANGLNLGGHFFIGHSETLRSMNTSLKTIEMCGTFFYQRPCKEEAPLPTSISPAPPLIAPKKGLSEFLNKTNIFLAKDDRHGAWKELQLWQAEDNLCTKAYYMGGVLLTEMNYYFQAIEQFQKAIYTDENLPLAHFHLAGLYLQLKRAAEAANSFQYCLKLLALKEPDQEVLMAEGITVGELKLVVEHALKVLKESPSL